MSDEEIDSDEEAPYDEESEDEGLVEMSDEDSEEPAEEEADPDAEDDESEGSDDADNDVSEELTTGTILHVNQCACVRQEYCELAVHLRYSTRSCTLLPAVSLDFSDAAASQFIPNPKYREILHY